MIRDALLALLVVALTFLSFGHSSAVFAAGGRVIVTAISVCGDPVPAGEGDHFACHACRPAVVDLPPPPVLAKPVVFAAVPVVYAEAVAPSAAAPLLRSARPRGPPLV